MNQYLSLALGDHQLVSLVEVTHSIWIQRFDALMWILSLMLEMQVRGHRADEWMGIRADLKRSTTNIESGRISDLTSCPRSISSIFF